MYILRLTSIRSNNLIKKIDEFIGLPNKNADSYFLPIKDLVNDGKYFVVVSNPQYDGQEIDIETKLLEDWSIYLDDVVSIEEFKSCIDIE